MHPLKCVWPIARYKLAGSKSKPMYHKSAISVCAQAYPDGPQLSDSIDIYGDSDISNLGPYSVYNYSVVENRPNCHICLVFREIPISMFNTTRFTGASIPAELCRQPLTDWNTLLASVL